MKRWPKVVELATNIAILCVCLLLMATVVNKFWLHRDVPPAVATLAKGTHFPIASDDWKGANRTLVLVLSTQCHFCSESADFYKRLSSDVAGHDVRMVAFLPQPVQEAQQYLSKLGIPNIPVRNADLSELKVSGTPTLILVDSNGVVRDTWTGKLPPSRESQVIAALN